MQTLPVLVVAQAGRTRDGLLALLKAIAQVQIIGLAKDVSSAHQLAIDHHPGLVLLDSSTCNGTLASAVDQIRSEWPEARCLVLVNNIHQQQRAKSAGADNVLLKGFAATRLFEFVEGLTKELAQR